MRKIIIYILIIILTSASAVTAVVLVKRNAAPQTEMTVGTDNTVTTEATNQGGVPSDAEATTQTEPSADVEETSVVNYEYLDSLEDAFYAITDADGMERIDEQRAIEVTQITPEMWDERGVYKYRVAEIAKTISMEIEIYDEPEKIAGRVADLQADYDFVPTDYAFDHSDIPGTFYEHTYVQNNGITAYCGLYSDGESYIIMYFSHDRIYELGEQRLIDFARTAQQLKGELINE